MAWKKKVGKSIFWYVVLPIAAFILLKDSIDKLLNTLLVQPILSNISPPNIFYDISMLTIALGIIIPFTIKIAGGAKIPGKWMFFILTWTAIYTAYRVLNDPFYFTPVSLCGQVKLMDLFSYTPILTLLLGRLSQAKVKTQTRIQEKGFIVDEPTIIKESSDLLNRSKFINKIAEKISNTSSNNGSFPIALVASWGSGKTTVLNSLKLKLNSPDYVLLDFNVWKCGGTNQIIETLFTLLKERLKSYSFTITNKISEYASNLLKGINGEQISSIRNFTDLLTKNKNLENQYDILNKEIISIGKKIIIFIDDLDRLDKQEIYEVIRLIRNTANFSNTFFIVAYDRNYVLNAIQEINPYNAHSFLEKIFQLEFTLPPISEKVIQSEITKRILPVLTSKGKEGYQYLSEKGFQFIEYGDADLTTFFVHNMRDVIRFINSFMLNYEFVKDEIYFPDFYNLELIKFKHPELFLNIYRSRHLLLTTDDEEKNDPTATRRYYSLKCEVDEKNNSTGVARLTEFIESRKDEYKLNASEISIICQAFWSIFPTANNLLSARTKGIDGHLSVLRPSMIDRYFILGITGRLSNIEFSKMRSSSIEEFLSKLTTLSKNEDLLVDLSERFEAITDFDDKDDFEKVIKGIFHFANLPHPNKQENRGFEQIRYNGKALATVLGKKNRVFLYEGNLKKYKEFLFGLLRTDSKGYTYTNDFVSSILHDNYYYLIGEIIEEKEIVELLLENFKNALAHSTNFSKQLWWHFTRCEKRKTTPLNGSVTSISYLKNSKATSLIKKFILEQDLDGFLLFSIRQAPFESNFILEDTIPIVFNNHETFIDILMKNPSKSEYKEEFLRFYGLLNDNSENIKNGVPLSFFQVIPVREKMHPPED